MNKFKLFGGEIIPDLGEYLRNYISKEKNCTIYVGTDSAQKGSHTYYATAVCLYDEKAKKGVHVIFTRERELRIRDTFTRLWGEAERTKNIAEYLEIELEGHAVRDDKFGKLCVIDLDFNPSPTHKSHGVFRENKSNSAYKACVGWLEGEGYKVRCKPEAVSASCAADLLCK